MKRKDAQALVLAALAAALLAAILKSQKRDIVIPPYEALLSEFD